MLTELEVRYERKADIECSKIDCILLAYLCRHTVNELSQNELLPDKHI